jgi:hypothetical protein
MDEDGVDLAMPRVSLMVGFWQRKCSSDGKVKYGPCATYKSAIWLNEILPLSLETVYGAESKSKSKSTSNFKPKKKSPLGTHEIPPYIEEVWDTSGT